MPTYIMLLTLTPEGREKMLVDAQNVLRAGREISMPDIQLLGLYGVLGDYDFVGILEAPDDQTVARYSLELGVKAGLHIATLPAIPIGRLEGAFRRDVPDTEEHGGVSPSEETPKEGSEAGQGPRAAQGDT